MDLRTQIDEKYKSAVKSKDETLVNTIRLIRSAIKNKDIENRTAGKDEPINDQQILSLLQILVKQRKDSIKYYKAGSRKDLIDKENEEIEIINKEESNTLEEKLV